jgi:hypothetical protein
VVLCFRRAPEFLAECSIRKELVIPLEWHDLDPANCCLNRCFLHCGLGNSPSFLGGFIEETFVDFACFCNRTRRTEVVSDALGDNVHWCEYSMGRYRYWHESYPDRASTREIIVVMARGVGCSSGCRIWNDAVAGLPIPGTQADEYRL